MLLLVFLPAVIVLMATLLLKSDLSKPGLFFVLALLACYLILFVGMGVLLAGVGFSGTVGPQADGARWMMLFGGLLGLSLLPMAALRRWLHKR